MHLDTTLIASMFIASFVSAFVSTHVLTTLDSSATDRDLQTACTDYISWK